MSGGLPQRAQVVVIGGGVVGCATAYHLARRGVSDVVLLERRTLTSGTTWHAAGLVTQARPTEALRRIVQYSLEDFRGLEADTGLSTGFRTTGTVHLALTPERREELARQASTAMAAGIEVNLLTPDEVLGRFPLLDPAGVLCGFDYVADGQGSASDTTMSLARGARQRGVTILENTPVTDVIIRNGVAVGVRTESGDIECEQVVNCTGMWGREFAGGHGVRLPLQALAHYYVVTDEIPDLPRNLPTLKSSDDFAYVKDEAGKLLVGFFEPGSEPWSPMGIPADAEFPTLPENWEHLGPFYERMTKRIPVLAEVGIRLFFAGPESFTPDGYFHLGEVAGLRNYLVACGFNSIGFLSGPGAGRYLAEWIVDGRPPFAMTETDPRRAMPHETNRRFLAERVVETLDLAYSTHWPYEQRHSGRPLRRSPLHDRVDAAGAVFGELGGWERANWFAPPGVERTYQYAFGRQNWFEHSAAEHRAVRTGVGMFDLSSFGKLLVQGPHAARLLQRVCANDVAGVVGRAVYTQCLNDQGGIEADVTVTRIAENEFHVLTAAASVARDADWIRRHVETGEGVSVADISAGLAMVAVMGPASRELLQPLTDADLSNEAFPFGDSREIDLGLGFVRATRLTYVGELGWELLISSDLAVHVYDTLIEAGKQHGLVHAGYHALNSLRLEKAYRSWGHDIGPDDSPLHAGLGFAVAWDKPGGFVGQAALQAQRALGVNRRMAQFVVHDPDVFVYHDEPIFRDGVVAGKVTSAMFGHTVGSTVALGYVGRPDESVDAAWVRGGTYEIEVAGERHPASVSTRPVYDPRSERVKA